MQVALDESERKLNALKVAADAVCRELEGGAQSGSSTESRLRALGDQVMARLRAALLLGVQKTLGVLSTHYQVQLEDIA